MVSASALGAEGRAFESLHPEIYIMTTAINYPLNSIKNIKKTVLHSYHIVDPSP